MNKIKYTAWQCTMSVLTLLTATFSPVLAEEGFSKEMDKTIENRILSLSSSVEARYSAEVKKRIEQYTIRQRKMSEILVGRSTLYFPTFEHILREKGLPTDLKYLSVIESGLKPSATSKSGAAGLWQFMRPTGRMLGLKINRTIDERRDMEKSTAAAAEYLLQLYNRFDDWTIAIAAYNCGPGNMRKAIRKSGGKTSYWEIQKYLPKETREYVPKFIAMSYVMNYYYEHDIVPQLPEEELSNTSSAKVFESINLKSLSEELDIELELMKTLNPIYVRNYIPKSEEGKYKLVLPTPEMRIVATKYHVLAALPQLKPKKEEVVVDNTPRPIIHMARLDQSTVKSKQKENTPIRLQSVKVRAVRYGEQSGSLEFKPDAYRISDKKKGIIYFLHLVKGARIEG